MAGEMRYDPKRQDPDALTPDVVPAPEAEVSRAEVDDFLGGPGAVSTPGMMRGWIIGTVVAGAIGTAIGAAIGAIVVASSSASPWWILGAAIIGAFCGGTIGFVLGGSFGTLKYDQGGRSAEEDDGGAITRGPESVAHDSRWHRPGRMGTSH